MNYLWKRANQYSLLLPRKHPKENRLNTEFFAISEFRMEDYYEPKAVVNE